MSRFLLKIFKYLIVIIFLNVGFIFLLGYFDHDMFKRIESVKFSDKRYNALFFGNSLALDGIDTKYLTDNGINSYNFAISGANTETNLVQLKDFLKNNKKPDLIVLCLSTCLGNFYNDREIEEIHPIVKYTRDFAFEDFNFPLSIFRWKIIEMGKILISKNHRNAEVVNGQYKSQKTIADNSTLAHNKFNIELLEKSKSLLRFSIYCQEHRIKLIFIDMPGYKSTRYKNNSNLVNYKLFESDLYQCNTVEIGNLFDSKNDWIANSHLNKYGAEKFTKIILSKILRNYIYQEQEITSEKLNQTHQGSK
jgi:hypothetical protein